MDETRLLKYRTLIISNFHKEHDWKLKPAWGSKINKFKSKRTDTNTTSRFQNQNCLNRLTEIVKIDDAIPILG